MKLSYEQSSDSGEGAGRAFEAVKGGGTGEGGVKSVGEGVVGGWVGSARVKPKGSSITLWGSGKKDGGDINNSMSLAVAYREVVL